MRESYEFALNKPYKLIRTIKRNKKVEANKIILLAKHKHKHKQQVWVDLGIISSF